MHQIGKKIDSEIFHVVGNVADALGRECYTVGGYVRDLFLNRHSKDIDFVTVGSGIEVATFVAQQFGRKAYLNVFKNFGTAQVKFRGIELEFVGARRESYRRDSRKPIVEDGTLDDDLSRRDFTINAMALCVNRNRFGELVDKYDGVGDLERGLIRTPLDPDITFSDDPLRMMRAIRFATQLEFTIFDETFNAITRNAQRIEIISKERVMDELMKIMAEYISEHYFYTIPAKSNVIETLKKLKEQGADLNVLTASPHGVLDPCLKRLGIYDIFTNVWSCDDFETTKADPDIYVRAAEKLGKKVEEVLFLDDNYNADKTAQSAGMKVCAVYDESSADYVEEMKTVSDYYIYDFKELLEDN